MTIRKLLSQSETEKNMDLLKIYKKIPIAAENSHFNLSVSCFEQATLKHRNIYIYAVTSTTAMAKEICSLLYK